DLTPKQFTPDSLAANFNKFSPEISEQQVVTNRLQTKSLPQTSQERSRSVSQTTSQIQTNLVKNAAMQALKKLMSPLGEAANKVVEFLGRAGSAIGTIISNGEAFLSNLVRALQTGFQQFSSKIATHLKDGLVSWLTGTLGSTGVTVPNKLDTIGVVSMVMQVLGINYGRLRGLLVKRIGEPKVKRLEKGFDLIQQIAKGGLVAQVQKMMQSPQELQKTVVESIRTWVIETVVKKAVAKLVATFSGFGAIAVAAEGIYNAIAFLIEKADGMQVLMDAIAASIGNIVAGQVAVAANYIESTLARSLSMAISFLARIVGLGNVGQKVREIIAKVRGKIDAAVNKLVDLVVKQGNDWLAKAGGGTPSNTAGGKPGVRPRPASRNPTPGSSPRPANRNPAPAPSPRPTTGNRTPGPSPRPASRNPAPGPSPRPASRNP
ncbi:hypothetical protein QUB37_29280, partial [Microcoleus sp. AT3-A2]